MSEMLYFFHSTARQLIGTQTDSESLANVLREQKKTRYIYFYMCNFASQTIFRLDCDKTSRAAIEQQQPELAARQNSKEYFAHLNYASGMRGEMSVLASLLPLLLPLLPRQE